MNEHPPLPLHHLRLSRDFTKSRTTLRDLPNGAEGRIARLDLPARHERRLLELGFLPGSRLRAIRRAPLGDPLEVEITGFRISIRSCDAAGIFLQ